jgi:hypothetical protein
MRADLVEVGTKAVESTLLSGAGRGGWDRGLGLEVPVHAFVATVLVRRSGLDEVRQDAELDPPEGERQPSAVDAKGTPLSVRRRSGSPNSWKTRVKT